MPPLHCEGSCRANLVANNVDEDVNDLGGVELRRHSEAMIEEEAEKKECQGWLARKWGEAEYKNKERIIYIGD